MLDQKTIKAGEYLIKEGDKSSELYASLSGSFEIVKGQGDQEQVIGEISPGELVGEMSFLDQEPRCASVRAVSDCEFLVIPREEFEDVFKSQPDWYQNIVKTLLRRLRKANDKLRV